mmetsp:Transcript_46757/g.100074  ORF Transcript_46757/g.100074 Transcript_46757/m.100074 type:complete len:209 (+) Transcript_46757:724-1350(+)
MSLLSWCGRSFSEVLLSFLFKSFASGWSSSCCLSSSSSAGGPSSWCATTRSPPHTGCSQSESSFTALMEPASRTRLASLFFSNATPGRSQFPLLHLLHTKDLASIASSSSGLVHLPHRGTFLAPLPSKAACLASTSGGSRDSSALRCLSLSTASRSRRSPMPSTNWGLDVSSDSITSSPQEQWISRDPMNQSDRWKFATGLARKTSFT